MVKSWTYSLLLKKLCRCCKLDYKEKQPKTCKYLHLALSQHRHKPCVRVPEEFRMTPQVHPFNHLQPDEAHGDHYQQGNKQAKQPSFSCQRNQWITTRCKPGGNSRLHEALKHRSQKLHTWVAASRCFICSTTPLCGQRMCNMLGAYNKMVGAEEKCLFCVLVLLRLCLCLCNKWMCVIKTKIHSFIFI